jgi:hypothetical protein
MRKLRAIALLVSIGTLGIGACCLSGGKGQPAWLRQLCGRLGPGASPAQASAPPPQISTDTQNTAGKLKAGMTYEQVKGVLGQPAMAQMNPGPQGDVHSAAWMSGDDTVSVAFQDNKALLVVSTTAGELAQEQGPAPKADADASAGGGGNSGAGGCGGSGGSAAAASADPTAKLLQSLTDLDAKVKQRNQAIEDIYKAVGK